MSILMISFLVGVLHGIIASWVLGWTITMPEWWISLILVIVIKEILMSL